MDQRARDIKKIGDSLFKRKLGWDELSQELAENFYPMRADFTQSFTLGEDFAGDLMESSPTLMREVLGNAPQAMLRQGDWFAVKTDDDGINDDPGASRWLEAATKRFRRAIYDRRANFTRATNEADHDWVTFGNPVLSVEESPDRTHFLFRSWHPGRCAWMENGIGQVDHLQRKMAMTARNMAKRWPKTIHADVKLAADNDPSKTFDCRHVVLPADDVYGDDRKMRRRFRGAPFLSLYIDCEHDDLLGEGPLPTFTYVVPRWRTLSGWAQGFSPAAINALPDGRMLQSLARIVLEQGEKAVDPPMVAKGDLFPDGFRLYAGGLTYADMEADEKLQDLFQTVTTGQGINIGFEMKSDVRQLIAESFLINKLTLPNVREMTAYETAQRMDEYRRAALPFFGPIESEYHLPLLDTAFTMAINNGLFDFSSAPPELKDYLQAPDGSPAGEFTFRFDSPLNTAEGRANVQAFQESVQILAGSAQFDKSVLSLMDFKQATEDAVKGTGAPSKWFLDEDRQLSQEEAQRQADQLAAAAKMLSGGAQVGKDVADASVALQQAGLAA